MVPERERRLAQRALPPGVVPGNRRHQQVERLAERLVRVPLRVVQHEDRHVRPDPLPHGLQRVRVRSVHGVRAPGEEQQPRRIPRALHAWRVLQALEARHVLTPGALEHDEAHVVSRTPVLGVCDPQWRAGSLRAVLQRKLVPQPP